MKHAFLRLPSLLGLLSLGSCFQVPLTSDGTVTSISGAPRELRSELQSESKAIANFNPDSKIVQQLTASSSSALAGSSITFQPGSIAISTDLIIEQAVGFGETSIITTLGLTEDVKITSVGAGLIIRPADNVALNQPLTIRMPLPIVAGLRLQNTRPVAVFYQQYIGDSLRAGMIPSKQILANDDDTVSFQGYFGAYWVAYLESQVTEAVEVSSEEPIVNITRVPVIESSGIVSETRVVEQEKIPDISWARVELKADVERRELILVAETEAKQRIKSCKADFYQKKEDTNGLSFDIGQNLSHKFQLKATQSGVYLGRLRCLDSEGRLSTSPWSEAVKVPALPEAPRISYDLCASQGAPLEIYAMPRTKMAGGSISMQYLGGCRYSATVYARGEEALGFLIRSPNNDFGCQSSFNFEQPGEAMLKCSMSTSESTPSPIYFKRANYKLILDFSKSRSQPSLKAEIAPCAAGAMTARIAPANNFEEIYWQNISPLNLQHHGACDYSATLQTAAGLNYWLKIHNTEETFGCGNSQVYTPGISSGPLNNICGAGTRTGIKILASMQAQELEMFLKLASSGVDTQQNNLNSSLLIRSKNDYSLPEALPPYFEGIKTYEISEQSGTWHQITAKWIPVTSGESDRFSHYEISWAEIPAAGEIASSAWQFAGKLNERASDSFEFLLVTDKRYLIRVEAVNERSSPAARSGGAVVGEINLENMPPPLNDSTGSGLDSSSSNQTVSLLPPPGKATGPEGPIIFTSPSYTWTAPDLSGTSGLEVQAYIVSILKSNPTSSPTSSIHDNITTQSFSLSISPGWNYQVSVQAVYSNGQISPHSILSNPVFLVQTTTQVPALTEAPTITASSGIFSVSWPLVGVNTGATGSYSYKIVVKKRDENGAYQPKASYQSSINSHTISYSELQGGPSPGSYKFSIIVVDSNGQHSAPSPEAEYTGL